MLLSHIGIFFEKIESADFSSLLALLGTTFVFFQYKKSFFQEQKQVIAVLRSKLDISEDWASARNNGYIGSPSDEQKIRYANPFHFVNEVENNIVDDLSLQPGIINFDRGFLTALARYNQVIQNIHGLIDFQKSLVAGAVRESLSVDRAIGEVPRSADYNHLKAVLDMKSGSESLLSKKLVAINSALHYKYIGSKESGGLKTLFHELEDGLKRQVKRKILKQLLFFNITFLLLAFLSTISLVSFSGFHLSSERIAYVFLVLMLIIFCWHELERRSWLSMVDAK